MYNITVLMSSYNGEQYIRQQIDSILNQKGVNVKLIIRDDGSNDCTLDILKQYAKDYTNVSWYTGENLRSAKSFMDLLFFCEENTYYAFADQDDVWDEDKLLVAIKHLGNNVLYCCKKRIVDENLNPLPQQDEYVKSITLGSSVLKCNVSGCTMVFTNDLRKKILFYLPKIISMHDAWVLKVATCVGKVYYDENAHMDYRQHRNNVVGAEKSFFELLRYRLKTFKNRKNDLERIEMAKQLHMHYGKYLNAYDEKYLKCFAYSRESIKNRLSIVFSNFLKTQKKFEIVFIKLFVLMGII